MKYEKTELSVPGQKTGPAVLTLYLLDALSVAPEKKRPLVIVLPGGGYNRRSDREREPVVMQFLAMGCHAAVLDYSVAPNRFPVALREAALAVAEIRGHAPEYHVDENAILVCGFSAGGHLACSVGTFWNRPVMGEMISETVGKTQGQIRPNGLILCYPVVTAGEFRHQGSFDDLLGTGWETRSVKGAGTNTKTNAGTNAGTNAEGDTLLSRLVSLELQAGEGMPPVFLWHTVTDETVPVENSLLLAGALRRAGADFEMHLYPTGRHGLSLATEETAGNRERSVEPCCQTWISLVKSWIENRFG